MHDAVVVGAGPNGLAAAITLARAGRSVLLVEGRETVGGGTRSEQLTLPGYLHDVCSAIHPLALASPFMQSVPLAEHGVEWIQPPAPLAHPLDDGTAVVLERSPADTGGGLGRDRDAWVKLLGPYVSSADALLSELLAPPVHLPRHPVLLARFGLDGLRPASALARSSFVGERARALFAGIAAHALLPLESYGTAAYGLVLAALGHSVGWPLARGGSQRIAEALGAYLTSLGGEIETGRYVESLAELAGARTVVLDVAPRQFLALAGGRLPSRYANALTRFRHGPGVFKLDWALSGPVPWRSDACARAATIHLGGTAQEIAASATEVARGRHPERPFTLVAQQSRFDGDRAPAGGETLWAYCHVPNGSVVDMTARVEAQIERFAPGFAELVIGRHVLDPSRLEAGNRNYVGGDINGGGAGLRQLLARPVARIVPYRTPIEGVFLCSASTPPGGGVHGMCGYNAARAALRAAKTSG